MNKVIITGNLTKDPTSRQFPTGSVKTVLRIANNDRDNKVCYVDVVAWGRTAEVARDHLSKGRKVLIEGRLGYSEWRDSNNSRCSKHEVIADRIEFLDSKPRPNDVDDEWTPEMEERLLKADTTWPF